MILTSNLGSSVILEGIENGELTDEAKDEVNTLLKRSFRPEFLNRLDEIVFFKPLEEREIAKIVKLFEKELSDRLAEKQLVLKVDEVATELIIRRGYDPVYGARPLKWFMQRSVQTMIAKALLGGTFTAGDTVLVTVENGEFAVRKA
jgi:ATP-dependent Clp protease ATP-binding subunit ClpB